MSSEGTSKRKRKKGDPTSESKSGSEIGIPPNLPTTTLSKPVQHSQLILDAVLKARKDDQKQLRELIRLLRNNLNESRQSEKDPLSLFPQEIWAIIFKDVKDVNNLANCSQTHPLFFSVINSTLQELLFGKVLPLVFPYLEKDFATNLITCGRVCKLWRAAVDRFADTYYGAEQPTPTAYESLRNEPSPHFRDKNMMEEHSFDAYPQLDAAGGSDPGVKYRPFLCKINLNVTDRYDNPREFTSLDSYGHCLWEATLMFGHRQNYTTTRVYEWCGKVFAKCLNMKSFCISDDPDWRIRNQVKHTGLNEDLELLVSKKLESLEVTVQNPGILAVQDTLLKKFSQPLKRLTLRHWNHTSSHALPWNNLADLRIYEGVSSEVLSSLQQMLAPKLHRLYVRLDSSCDFLQLFKALNNFPNLRYLTILLTEAFDGDILSVPLDFLTVA